MGRTLLIFGVILAGASSYENARGQDLIISGIENCRKVSNDVERLSCYDNIETSASLADAEDTEDTDDARISADFGLPDTEQLEKIYSVALDDCGAASNRFFYFYFENGQIWKYVGNKKLRYTNCPKSADVNEDRFGYKLRLQGETRWHRVQRMK